MASIKIKLEPYLEDYLRYVFSIKPKEEIQIHRQNDIGRCIMGVLIELEFPEKQLNASDLITIHLPTLRNVDLDTKFVSVDKWGNDRIRDYILAEFNANSKAFFEIGYERNFQQKDIVDAFLHGYNIRNNSLSFEAVKKSDYRRRKKKASLVFNEIQGYINQYVK